MDYGDNKKTKVKGTIINEFGKEKVKTWTIYNIYENYNSI